MKRIVLLFVLLAVAGCDDQQRSAPANAEKVFDWPEYKNRNKPSPPPARNKRKTEYVAADDPGGIIIDQTPDRLPPVVWEQWMPQRGDVDWNHPVDNTSSREIEEQTIKRMSRK